MNTYRRCKAKKDCKAGELVDFTTVEGQLGFVIIPTEADVPMVASMSRWNRFEWLILRWLNRKSEHNPAGFACHDIKKGEFGWIQTKGTASVSKGTLMD